MKQPLLQLAERMQQDQQVSWIKRSGFHKSNNATKKNDSKVYVQWRVI
jgi:hypothetical protein